MNQYSGQIRTFGILAIFMTALMTGCQSLRTRISGNSSAPSVIPALSATPGSLPPAADAHSAEPGNLLTNSSQTVQADHVVSKQNLPPVPPLPHEPSVTPVSGTAPSSGELAAGQHWRTIKHDANCLPDDAEWRKQIETQTADLSKKVTQLEGELTTARETLQQVTSQLQESNGKIQKLNEDISHWKGEVRRLEEDMKAQQLADLKSLDELTETMHHMLMKQQRNTSLPSSESKQ